MKIARVEGPGTVPHAAEIAYSVLILVWYVLTLLVPSEGLFSVLLLPGQLFGGPPANLGALILTSVMAYLVPVICLFKIAAIFLDRSAPALAVSTRIVPVLLNILCSALVAGLIVTHIVAFARNSHYFQAFSPLTYVAFLASIGFNAYFISVLIAGMNRRDSAYGEYLEFRRTTEGRMSALSVLTTPGIQRSLIVSFVPLMLVTIAVLSFVLMRDFSGTILASVIQEGRTLAERTTSVIKANPSDMIAADDYLSFEAKTNATAPFPFRTISFWRRDPRSDIFTVAASTTRMLVGGRSMGKTEPFTESTYRYDRLQQTFTFTGPVTLGGKFLGYVTVDYDRDVIYEPYFRTRVKVFVIAALFLYASVFLTYLFGRNIVFPILFLRMNVNAISKALSAMVKGRSRVSAELLQYRDHVFTRGEIKSLSTEIGTMTTVIRGIVPYISASTLQHAERDTPATESKDLTFLFTDIRGFTALCEGLSPDTVVEMLNHFLDIQSSVIIANGGDVDKFVGDEVMAMFDGPDKEHNACKTSIEINRAIAAEKELAQASHQNIIAIGTGINTGPVVSGSVGARDRMDFTSIGDTVNLAARLEGVNKQYGTKTLISGAVYEKVKDLYLCREVDWLTVKGKMKIVTAYELLQAHRQATRQLMDMKRIFEEGLAFYRGQKWSLASRAFGFLKENMDDEASAVFLGRIDFFTANPPGKGWDGVFRLAVK
jgi:class 3 adenylate cyclase